MQGDTSEDHIGHALWNLGAILHFRKSCKHEIVNEEQKDDKDI